MITAEQVRAARGLLNWSQSQLADLAKVSRSTVHDFERGATVGASMVMSIGNTLIEHGVEFLENSGVRLKGIRDFNGPGACDLLFNDILKTITAKGGNFVCAIHSKPMLMRPTGEGQTSNLQRLEQVQKLTEVKCLRPGQENWDLPKPSFPVRQAGHERSPIAASYFCYGDILVVGFLDAMNRFAFVVVENEKLARNYQSYFLERWNKAA